MSDKENKESKEPVKQRLVSKKPMLVSTQDHNSSHVMSKIVKALSLVIGRGNTTALLTR